MLSFCINSIYKIYYAMDKKKVVWLLPGNLEKCKNVGMLVTVHCSHHITESHLGCPHYLS